MTTTVQTDQKDVIIEMKLCVNQRLYANGYITTEMYEKAKTLILQQYEKRLTPAQRNFCCM